MSNLVRKELLIHKAAITPDQHSRGAYGGRIMQTETVTIFSDDGTAFERDVQFTISWDSIVKILDLIEKRVEDAMTLLKKREGENEPQTQSQ